MRKELCLGCPNKDGCGILRRLVCYLARTIRILCMRRK